MFEDPPGFHPAWIAGTCGTGGEGERDLASYRETVADFQNVSRIPDLYLVPGRLLGSALEPARMEWQVYVPAVREGMRAVEPCKQGVLHENDVLVIGEGLETIVRIQSLRDAGGATPPDIETEHLTR